MKKSNSVNNPERKRVNFKCQDCGGVWKKPVPYFIRHQNKATESLVEPFEKEICKKCAVREFGSRSKKRKEFFNEV